MATDIFGGVASFMTVLAVASSTAGGNPPWLDLLVALGSALIYATINIIVKIIVAQLKKKGKISAEDAKAIDSTLDDLSDDGKINGSNKTNDKK